MTTVISKTASPLFAAGPNFVVRKCQGSGPGYMHVHHEDDECWYVIDGELTFRLPEGEVAAPAGTTVFVPAGTAHDYYESREPSTYLLILSPRLNDLIDTLHKTPIGMHAEVFKQFASEIPPLS